jgi:hypothetical protein
VADPCPVISLCAFRLRREHNRLYALADLGDLITELDQIAIRVRRLEESAQSEVERLQHWRRLAQLGAQRAEYCERQRRLMGGAQ